MTMADTPERRPSDVAPSAQANRPAITSEDVDRSQASSATAGTNQTSARSGAGAKTEQAKEQASHMASQAKEQARAQANRFAEEAKQRGRSMLEEQKGNAVSQLSGFASVLRETASKCAEREDQRTAGRALEQAAGGLERFADALRSRDVDSLMDQAARMARQQPAVFIGGTIAAGFLLSRFLKSSADRPHGHAYDDEAFAGRQSGSSAATPGSYMNDSGAKAGEGRSYVTSAHANPNEVSGRPVVPPVTPTGRRDF
jgi:hypothetical protein